VWLEGEAFFKVTKQGTEGNALFIVHTADLEVHVLGTRFNVQQRSAQTKVSLNEGNVRLLLPQAKSLSRAKPQAITMKPGELVAFSQQDRRIVRKRVDPTLYSAWTSRKYIFRNTPLREIIATLEQNYGVDVVVKDSAMLRQSLSGTVVSDDLPTLLKALSATADLDIQQNGKQILFQRKE
jgi:ferric-dicitrate binding protein FerR (iron transport regulator)